MNGESHMRTTEELVLTAKAMGFDEASAAHDVLAKAQEKLAETSKSLEEARGSGSIRQVADLTKEEEKLQQTVGLLSGKNEQASGSMANFGDQLRRVHPLVGDFISVLSRYNSVAALVGVAIAGITAAARNMREEFERSTKSVRDQADALTTIKGQERATQQSIEDTRATSKAGPFRTPEKSSAAMTRFNKVREQYPWITDEGAVANAAAFASGDEYSVEETARLARLFQLHPDKVKAISRVPAPALPGFIRGRLTRNAPELDKTFQLETAQKYLGEQLAGAQLTRDGGSTLELQDALAKHAPPGAKLNFLAELAQELKSVERVDEISSRLGAGLGVPAGIARVWGSIIPGADNPILHASQEDLAIVRKAMMQLRSRRGQGPSEQPEITPGPREGIPHELYPREPHSSASPVNATPSVVNNHYDNRSYNARNISPFAAGQASAARNGETRARDLELV